MKKINFKSIISAALALIMTVGIFAVIPAPTAAAETYERGFNSMRMYEYPTTLYYGFVYDGFATMYEGVYNYLDIDYLVEQFSEDLSKFKEYSLELAVTSYMNSKVYEGDNTSITFHGMKTSMVGTAVTSDYYDDKVVNNQGYKTVLSHSNYKNSSGLPVMETGDVVIRVDSKSYLKEKDCVVLMSVKLKGNRSGAQGTYDVEKERIYSLNLYPATNPITNFFIYDFDQRPLHGTALDTEATPDFGECVSIKYYKFKELREDHKLIEVTNAVAGERLMVEFTIVKPHSDFEMYLSGQSNYNDGVQWDRLVVGSIQNGGSLTDNGVALLGDAFDANMVTMKFYAPVDVKDNADYVITQGTIGLTVPEAGAKANKDVETSNVKKIVRRGPTGAVTSSPQFTVDKAAWLNIDKRGTMKYVDSFAAGNIYHALVKLTPDGNYYFNADSVAALQVPGADSFNIGYMKAGDVNGFVKEDGWYLLANFSVKNGSTPDTTPITTPVTTPPVTEPRTPMSLLPVGAQNIVVNDTATDFSFEVMAQNATGNVRYMWQACDSNGNVSDPTELSNGQAFLHHGMSMADNGKTQYYKCTAISGSDIASLVFSVKLELQYFDLKVSYSNTDITVTQGDVATITATTNVDISRATEKTIQWHVAKDQDGLAERDVDGANDLTFSIPTGSAGTYYYRCSIGCKLDGKFDSLDYTSASPWVKVTVKEKTVSPLTISVIGDKDLTLATSGTDYLFQVKTQNATGAVKYSWYACDQNGNVTDNKVLSATDTLVRKGGISEADRDKTLYFKCVATDSKNTASVVCSAILKTKYFDLTIKYNKLDVTAAQGESVSVAAQTNIDPALVSDLVIEWWRADNADGKNEKKVAGQSGLTLVVPTTAEGTAYYRCNVTCKRDGEFSRTVYSSAKYVKVTVTAKAEVTAEPPVTTDKQQDVTTAALITPGEPDVTKEPTVDVTTAPEDVTSPADTTKTPEPAVTTGNTPSDRDSSGATVWVIIGVVAAALVAAVVAVLLIKKKRK